MQTCSWLCSPSEFRRAPRTKKHWVEYFTKRKNAQQKFSCNSLNSTNLGRANWFRIQNEFGFQWNNNFPINHSVNAFSDKCSQTADDLWFISQRLNTIANVFVCAELTEHKQKPSGKDWRKRVDELESVGTLTREMTLPLTTNVC